MPAVNNEVKRQDRSPVLSAGAVKLKDKHSKYEKLDKTAHQVLTLTVQCNTGINVCRPPGTNTDCTM
jgi:hypothetical protein